MAVTYFDKSHRSYKCSNKVARDSVSTQKTKAEIQFAVLLHLYLVLSACAWATHDVFHCQVWSVGKSRAFQKHKQERAEAQGLSLFK